MYFALSVLAIGGAVSALAAPAHGWTEETTEKFWSYIVEISERATTEPRFEKADAETGEGILEAFGTKYMPNAYTLYQKKREMAKEREAMYKENFPEGRKSDVTGGELYDKIKKSVTKAVSEMDRRHDELCHYYLLHKIGVMTDDELSKIDSLPICTMLPSTNDIKDIQSYECMANTLTAAERTFAGKYLPAILSGYDYLWNVFSEGKKAYSAIRSEMIMIDATRSNAILKRLRWRLDMVLGNLDPLVDIVKKQKLLYAVEEVTSDQLAKVDKAKGLEIQSVKRNCPVRAFVLNTMGETWDEELLREAYWSAPVVALPFTMVRIPGMKYAVCKYEVTKRLYATVMQNDFNNYNSYNFPVKMTWNRSTEFIKKLNTLPEVKSSDLEYRLPTRDEWMYACKAGAKGDYCMVANGREITAETLDDVARYFVARYAEIVGDGCWAVGLKTPNAFGLYDMLGNVSEWCTDTMWVEADTYRWLSSTNYDGYRHTALGGSSFSSSRECKASFQEAMEERQYKKGIRSDGEYEYGIEYIGESGMRLVVSLSPETLRKVAEQENAEKLYRKAVEQGDAIAQLNLGICYTKGKGVKRDKQEAVKWYRKAAEQGNAEAQCELGISYIIGKGVEKNRKEAVNWFHRAAEQGYDFAQYMLGRCYEYGLGVEKSKKEAEKWYCTAAANGCIVAEAALRRLGKSFRDGKEGGRWGGGVKDVERTSEQLRTSELKAQGTKR